MIGNLIVKLPTKMQTGYLVLGQIAVKCLPEVDRGIVSSVFATTPTELEAAGSEDKAVGSNVGSAGRQCM